MKKAFKPLFLSIFFLTGAISPTFANTPPQTEFQNTDVMREKVDGFLFAVKDRLELMHDVAKWKWNTGSPIEDKKRESVLLSSLMKKSRMYGLDPADVNALFTSQIEAAKSIQIKDFETWIADEQEKVTMSRDLNTELRPEIDAASSNLLMQYREIAPYLNEPKFDTLISERAAIILDGEGIDSTVRDQALNSIFSIKK